MVRIYATGPSPWFRPVWTAREHVPMALELGMGITPWSPLAGGLLTGKYQRNGDAAQGEGRIVTAAGTGMAKLSDRKWKIIEALGTVAKELGRSPAQVVLNRFTRRPGVASTIIGATRLDQLEDNLKALEFELPEPLARKLDELSAPEVVFPYTFFTAEQRQRFSGGVEARAEPRWFRPLK